MFFETDLVICQLVLDWLCRDCLPSSLLWQWLLTLVFCDGSPVVVTTTLCCRQEVICLSVCLSACLPVCLLHRRPPARLTDLHERQIGVFPPRSFCRRNAPKNEIRTYALMFAAGRQFDKRRASFRAEIYRISRYSKNGVRL